MNKLIAFLLLMALSFGHSGQYFHQERGWIDHWGLYQGPPGCYLSYWEDTVTFYQYNAHLALNHIDVKIEIRSDHRWEYHGIVPPFDFPVFITDRNELLSLYVIDDTGGEILIATLNSPINDERTMSGPTGQIVREWRTFLRNSKTFRITDPAIMSKFIGPGEVHLKITSLNNVGIASQSPSYIWFARTTTGGRVLIEYHQ